MGLTLGQRRAVRKATATRYRWSSKNAKGLILDALCTTTAEPGRDPTQIQALTARLLTLTTSKAAAGRKPAVVLAPPAVSTPTPSKLGAPPAPQAAAS